MRSVLMEFWVFPRAGRGKHTRTFLEMSHFKGSDVGTSDLLTGSGSLGFVPCSASVLLWALQHIT